MFRKSPEHFKNSGATYGGAVPRPAMLDSVTPVILTYNEAPNIGSRLRELSWASDIVIVDSFSEDATVTIASAFAQARVFQRKFDDHVSQWNFALRETGIKTDWVLALDADYRLPAEFLAEVETLDFSGDIDGYSARFVYCIHGRPIRSGLYPPVIVLYRRNLAEYVHDGHTQRVVVNGSVETLKSNLYHDDRKPLATFVAAQDRYAKLEVNKILSSSAQDLNLADRVRQFRVIAPLTVLPYCLIYRLGIFDGWRGLVYAFQRLLAETLLSLHLIEHDLNRRAPEESSANEIDVLSRDTPVAVKSLMRVSATDSINSNVHSRHKRLSR